MFFPDILRYAKAFFVLIAITMVGIILADYLWVFILAPNVGADLGVFGWYLFAFLSGVSLFVFPCLLPISHVIVPLTKKDGFARGLWLVLTFGFGIAITLALYGAAISALGSIVFSKMLLDSTLVTNWAYLFAGLFAYVFALGELGLIKFDPTHYTGAAPGIVKRGETFLLGMFMGNIGIGCVHPAMPLLFVSAALSGNLFYGSTLFAVHALGRIIPFFMMAMLAALRVDPLKWLVAKRVELNRLVHWKMLAVSGFILTLGLFTNSWFANSGIAEAFLFIQHSIAGSLTSYASDRTVGSGIFGQSLVYGSWVLIFLWLLPLWWSYGKQARHIYGMPEHRIAYIESQIARLEKEHRHMEVLLHLRGGEQGAHLRHLEDKIDALNKEQKVQEIALRYGKGGELVAKQVDHYEQIMLRLRRNWYLTLSLLLIGFFIYYLPSFFSLYTSTNWTITSENDFSGQMTVQEAMERIDAALVVMPHETPTPTIE